MTFDEFVRANTRGLLGLVVAMSGDQHLAEDLVQDVLIKVYQRWHTISALDDPPSYVRLWNTLTPWPMTILERRLRTPPSGY